MINNELFNISWSKNTTLEKVGEEVEEMDEDVRGPEQVREEVGEDVLVTVRE